MSILDSTALPRRIKTSGIAGWTGMALLQGSTLPTLLNSLEGSAHLPPLSLTVMTWLGLSLYLWNSIATNNTLYTVGNAIGLTLNTIMIGLIIL